jgi:tellurite resistance protein TerC
MKKYIINTAFWILSAITFGGFVAYFNGIQDGLTFYTGYLVEKLLSIDNLFMFLVIFNYFKLPINEQSKCLSYGIIGAITFRTLFIMFGTALALHIPYIIPLFGVLLLYNGIKLIFKNEDPESSNWGKFLQNKYPSLSTLLLAIIAIEITDIIFAMDSLPAILGITTNKFLFLSSNIFAILGLRSLYFVILELIKKFTYLEIALSVILSFIGIKMLISPFYQIGSLITFACIISTFIITILFSLEEK